MKSFRDRRNCPKKRSDYRAPLQAAGNGASDARQDKFQPLSWREKLQRQSSTSDSGDCTPGPSTAMAAIACQDGSANAKLTLDQPAAHHRVVCQDGDRTSGAVAPLPAELLLAGASHAHNQLTSAPGKAVSPPPIQPPAPPSLPAPSSAYPRQPTANAAAPSTAIAAAKASPVAAGDRSRAAEGMASILRTAPGLVYQSKGSGANHEWTTVVDSAPPTAGSRPAPAPGQQLPTASTAKPSAAASAVVPPAPTAAPLAATVAIATGAPSKGTTATGAAVNGISATGAPVPGAVTTRASVAGAHEGSQVRSRAGEVGAPAPGGSTAQVLTQGKSRAAAFQPNELQKQRQRAAAPPTSGYSLVRQPPAAGTSADDVIDEAGVPAAPGPPPLGLTAAPAADITPSAGHATGTVHTGPSAPHAVRSIATIAGVDPIDAATSAGPPLPAPLPPPYASWAAPAPPPQPQLQQPPLHSPHPPQQQPQQSTRPASAAVAAVTATAPAIVGQPGGPGQRHVPGGTVWDASSAGAAAPTVTAAAAAAVGLGVGVAPGASLWPPQGPPLQPWQQPQTMYHPYGPAYPQVSATHPHVHAHAHVQPYGQAYGNMYGAQQPAWVWDGHAWVAQLPGSYVDPASGYYQQQEQQVWDQHRSPYAQGA